MFRRQQVKTHGHLMRAELGEGIGHFRQAATHAVDGVSSSLGPRIDSARTRMAPTIDQARGLAAERLAGASAALMPLMAAARDGAGMRANMARAKLASNARMSARKASMKKEMLMSRKRRGLFVGLIAAGVAAGAAGAIVARRRNRSSWEEYESHGVGAMNPSLVDAAQSAAERARDDVATTAEQSSRTAGDWSHGGAGGTRGAAGGSSATGGSSAPSASGDGGKDAAGKAGDGREFVKPAPGPLKDKTPAGKNGRS